jgi:hypothetical protein
MESVTAVSRAQLLNSKNWVMVFSVSEVEVEVEVEWVFR